MTNINDDEYKIRGSKLRRETVKEGAEYLSQARGGEIEDFIKEADRLIWRDPVPYRDDELLSQGFVLKETYDFNDSAGKLHYQDVRYEHPDVPGAKRFKIRRPGSDVRWISGQGDLKIPYNWVELVRRPNETVFWCEGGKDANTLIKLGLLATYAASNLMHTIIAKALAGRNVVIIPDNDDKGRRNADAVENKLLPFAKSIRRIDDLPVGPTEDVTDWINAGHTVDELLALVDSASLSNTIAAVPYNFPAEKDIKRWDWLLGSHLMRGEVAGTAAMGGTGKSNLGITEALAMTSGKRLLHDSVPTRPLRVILINLEDSRNTMDKRIAAVMRQYVLTKADIGDRLIVFAKGELKFKIARQVRGEFQRNERDIKRLTDLMIKLQGDVLSIDSFVRTHGVNENDNDAITQVVECYEEIVVESNSAVHLWHHTRKSNGDGATVESSRGAQAFIDACRSVRILETMTKKERDNLATADSEMGEARWYFREFNGKRNFAPPSDESKWFRYVSLELDNAPGLLDHGDRVGVVTPWQYPVLDLSTAKSQVGRDIALTAVAAGGPWRRDQRSKKEPWVGLPIIKAFGMNPEDKRVKNAIDGFVQEWIDAGLLRKVTKKNDHRENVEYVEVERPAEASAGVENPASAGVDSTTPAKMGKPKGKKRVKQRPPE